MIHGKIEEITLPDGIAKVDIILSEWMGYALLYESMLDSVLVARDRFLRPGGVMAPSQCKMMFGLTEAREIYKDRIGFWSDIYGAFLLFIDALRSLIVIRQVMTFQQWLLKSTMMQ